ncbi:flagellar attachment zone protein 1-like [Oryzias latipes]|uniref:flagellar attachment zone protein 1-like n=1 Tax=Oryzias latipes TaxID=8090 RepID=UPI000CE27180|nr:flagellar attachment zone protein 1-like [Oryzias latipes]
METSRRRPVRKTQKNFQLSNLELVVENESTFEFWFDSTSPKKLATFMDWDDIDEDNDYSPPSDDEEEFPETPETPHYDYSPLYKSEDEEFPETLETPEPKRQQDWENAKPKTCPQNQTLGLKPLSFAPPVSFRPAAFFPVKRVSVPEKTQPKEIKPLGKGKQSATALDEPTSTSESTSVENAEELQVENTMKSEVERLKELLQQKDQKLADAALKADHFKEQMSHKTELLAKAETSLSHLTETQKQLAKEREENTSLKQEMAELRKAHEEDKAATEKKILESLSNNEKPMEQLRETITEKETIMSKFEKVSRTRIVKLLGQIDDLKMEQRKKDYMLAEAAGKAEHLEEQKNQERQQWQEEKSSVLQEITQLKTALKDKETEVTKSKKVSKKKNVQLLRQMHDLKVQHEQEQLDFTSKLEMEKKHLLKDHQLALTKVQNQLAEERERWLGEYVSLKQEMFELRIAHEEEKAAIKKSNADSSGEIFKLQYHIEDLKRRHEEKFKIIMDNFEKERMHLKEDHNMRMNSQMEMTNEEIQRCEDEKDSLLKEMDKLERNCEKHKAACYRAQKKISELLSTGEMEKLKRTIREKDAITDILKKKLEKSDQRLETITEAAFRIETNLNREIQLLKEKIEQERIKTNQAKLSFDLEVKESTKLRAALVQKKLEGQQQLEEERQQLEEERQQLEEEKSTLSQQIAHLKKVVKKKKTIIRKTQEDFQVQIHQLQQQVDELKEKTPKKSVGRRFLNLFRRSRKKD